jgi:hypothetical protein
LPQNGKAEHSLCTLNDRQNRCCLMGTSPILLSMSSCRTTS